jgi:hypothetical protein
MTNAIILISLRSISANIRLHSSLALQFQVHHFAVKTCEQFQAHHCTRKYICSLYIMHASWLDHAISTAAQTDDFTWHCFFWGFHSKRVADVQKHPAVSDLLTVMRSVLCTVH